MSSNKALISACLLGTILAMGLGSKATAQVAYDPIQAAHLRANASTPYGYVYNPRRAYRQALRYGYPPLFQAWPPMPVGHVYYGNVPQPSFGPPQQTPTPAIRPRPTESSAAGVDSSSGTAPALEPIPAPNSDVGPRQF
jgi:hypothetical protein